MTVLTSPGFIPPAVAVDGDRVRVIPRNSDGDGIIGYQLPAPPGFVRVAAEAVDDNRLDKPEDWWRATYRAGEVRVVLIQRRPCVFV
ncbi:hypothetical protein [Cryobacterium sp. Y11]|uniref:hypothetical protein n=1 Tax=Cryobacterium sp. Y11 TaxID=2045016 RepID=UPI000CE40177|nr:hypothetical protein [Cryobacterium sp. Y11]